MLPCKKVSILFCLFHDRESSSVAPGTSQDFAMPTTLWQWHDGKKWINFEKKDSDLLQKHRHKTLYETRNLTFNMEHKTLYRFNFSALTQYNTESDTLKHIRPPLDDQEEEGPAKKKAKTASSGDDVSCVYMTCHGTKFWEVTVQGKTATVRFGKVGSAGQSKSTTYATTAACQKEVKKTIASKKSKGYVVDDDEENEEAEEEEQEEEHVSSSSSSSGGGAGTWQQKVKGRRFCLSGTLSVTRAVASARLIKAGATVTKTLSASTHVLLIGDNPGTKVALANALGVAVWREEDVGW
eukprot:g7888.t1